MFTFPFGFMAAAAGGGVDGEVISDVSYDNVQISTIAAVTGLTGDSKDYTVVMYTHSTADDKDVFIDFNGDSTFSNYVGNGIRTIDGSTLGKFAANNLISDDGFAQVSGLFVARITGSSGARRLCRSSSSSVRTSSSVGVNTYDIQWTNTADEITSLQVNAHGTSSLFSGRIVVYEHGKIGDAAMGNLELIGTKTFSASSAAQSFTGLDGDVDGFYRVYNDLSIGNMELKSNINTTDSDSGRSNVLNSSGSLSVSADTTDIPDFDLQADVILSAVTGADRPMKGNINALLNTNNANTYNYLNNTATNIDEIIFDPDVAATGSAHLYKSTDGMFDTMPFELVETKVLVEESADSVSPIQFTGLTGDSEFLYKVTAAITCSSDKVLYVRINNDQAYNYKWTMRTNITSGFTSTSVIANGKASSTQPAPGISFEPDQKKSKDQKSASAE